MPASGSSCRVQPRHGCEHISGVGFESPPREWAGRMFRRRIDDLIAALVGLALLVVCGVLASSGEVGRIELGVFHAVNGMPDALSPAMRVSQLLGVLVIGPIVAVGALFLRKWRLALAALIV